MMTKEIRLAKQKRRNQKIAFGLFQFTSYAVVGLLFVILAFIVIKGIGVISWEFISEMPKERKSAGDYQS